LPDISYFDPTQPVSDLSGNLPHWRQTEASYFVTFRLADAMPQSLLAQWQHEREHWHAAHPEPHDGRTRSEYFTRFPQRFQDRLDAGHGSCILRRPEIKSIVEDALRHFDGQRYDLVEFVVMPNHVHVLVTPLADHALSDILHSWKSFTAHRINLMLGTCGEIWQKESFDHIVRSPMYADKIIRYIRDNPRSK